MAQIAPYKKEWKLCGGCFCANNYLVPVQGCAATDFEVLLCYGGDSTVCIWGDGAPAVPQMCTLLPCCVVYPKFGCCANVRTIYEGDEEMLRSLNPKKLDAWVKCACCLGQACKSNKYCFVPYTLCDNEGSTCCCVGSDCAFPCSDTIPFTFGLYGLMCFGTNGIACCPVMGDTYPSRFAGNPDMGTGQQVGQI